MRRDDPGVSPIPEATALPAPARAVIEALTPCITEARLARIEAVVARRTLRIVPVLEGLTDPHNVSAVLRSADAFGVQEVHVIEGPHGFTAAPRISRRTDRWLDLVRHADASSCVAHLRSRGYRILVAAMDGEIRPEALNELPKAAVVFGHEHEGVSSTMQGLADATYAVPMVGFVESLNVSVATAITLYTATAGQTRGLPPEDRDACIAGMLMRSVQDAERIVLEHLRGRSHR